MVTRVSPFSPTPVVATAPFSAAPSGPQGQETLVDLHLPGRPTSAGSEERASRRQTEDRGRADVTCTSMRTERSVASGIRGTLGYGEANAGSSRGSAAGRSTLTSAGTPPGEDPKELNGHRNAIRTGTQKLVEGNMLDQWKRKLRGSYKDPLWKICCRKIVENKYSVGFTTLLTVYALIGDDIRLLATNKPADNWFNAFTLTCLVVFTFEIALSVFGKSDYFLGFFFWLDVISTFTLVLDLTWVAALVFGTGEGVDKLRSGRTARVGAKAGRVVRVIRLVRIIKLWKAIQDAKQERQRRENAKANGGEDVEDWGEDEDPAKARLDKDVRESRVGKKLSEMTTRRVIILVLTMLLVLPFLQTDSGSLPPESPWFAADTVYELFLEYNASQTSANRLRYERAMLKYFYYFNWFTGNIQNWVSEDELSPRRFQSHVFWAGIMSEKEDTIHRSYWPTLTQIRSSTIAAYDEEIRINNSKDIYVYGRMPNEVMTLMSSQWRYGCNYKDEYFRYGFSVLTNEMKDLVSYKVECPEDLRPFELDKYWPRSSSESEHNAWHFAFYFDLRPKQRSEAMYGLIVTFFICMVLCVASLYFSNDANRLVLRPVENMIKRVEIIRNDPLIAVQMADEEFKAEEREKAIRANQAKHHQALQGCKEAFNCLSTSKAEVMETVILEKTIIKLGSLLALGFGEAGANIIGHNLESSDSAGVNAMIQGERVEAIIGLAKIKDFSTATEVLKARVMTFVNQIAEIVHGVVSEYHGAANKNNGDTFLLIWRISGIEDVMKSRMADMSTIAFAKILGAVHRSPILASYRGHPALQQRLGGNCRVCLTFGLHAGWAIEGAVGSEFKIDASYLSPNVSIAVQVEQATYVYGVHILATEQVVALCCEGIAAKYRKIDRVVIRGSADARCLYALDLDYLVLTIDDDMSRRPASWNSRLRFKARQFLEAEKQRKLDPEVKTCTMFDQCRDIAHMRRRYSIEFIQLFNMGFQNYLEGEWPVAGRLLTDTRWMLRYEDGPSSALLRFMEGYHFQSPRSWNGVHDLSIFVHGPAG